MKDQISSALQAVCADLGFPTIQPEVEVTDMPSHGDYTTTIAMQLAKPLKRKPLEIAEDIKTRLLSREKSTPIGINRIDILPPGFINFFLEPHVAWKTVQSIVAGGMSFASVKQANPQTMIIDYSAPNIAKRFSIGHLRSTIVGNALERLYEHLGWVVVGDNHLGDWGTQFGKMIVAIRKWTDGNVPSMTIEQLEALYVRYHTEAESQPELDEEARQTFKKLEEGSAEERSLWKQLIMLSMKEFDAIYALLDVRIDETIGESYYEQIMQDVIRDAKKKGIAIQDKGAWIIQYPQDALPPSMLLKTDGGTTYLTRDLATIKYRMERWHPDRIVYEVGSEQTLHFRQVFWAAELLGYAKRSSLVHVGHGMIRLPEGKMSTRKGRTVKLTDVLEKAIQKAGTLSSDPAIARTVGIGAVKYNDLKHSPQSGYTFEWDEILNLEGNSGPYLQYALVRCKSILEKASGLSVPEDMDITEYAFQTEELALMRSLGCFPDTIQEAANRYSPSVLCHYLFSLSQSFSSLYNAHSILGADSKEGKYVRITLTKAVLQVLKIGLTILGIGIPERM